MNPDEQQAVQDLIDEAQQLKEQAQAVVKDLPAGDTKDGYQARLNGLTDLEAPAVTDKDSDGKLDTEEYTEADEAVKKAEEAVKKAEEAYKKAEEAIAKYPEGSVVNPDEQQAVQDLIDEV